MRRPSHRLSLYAGLSALVLAFAVAPAAAQDRAVDSLHYQLQVETLAGGLEHPWGLALMPDGRFLVTERNPGQLRIGTADGQLSDPVEGVPEIFRYEGDTESSQGGLFDVRLHPDFEENQLVYLSLSKPSERGAGTAVVRGRLVEADGAARLEEVETVFEMNEDDQDSGGLHFGGRTAFHPEDKTLFVTIGDRRDISRAQDPEDQAGSLIRVTDEGEVPPDNPFAGDPEVDDKIYSCAVIASFRFEEGASNALDKLTAAGVPVHAIGKVEDLFAGRGITSAVHTKSDDHGMDEVFRAIATFDRGLIFANLVDFDTRYGHRNDVRGYADNLERFDRRLAELLPRLRDDDILIVGAGPAGLATAACLARTGVPFVILERGDPAVRHSPVDGDHHRIGVHPGSSYCIAGTFDIGRHGPRVDKGRHPRLLFDARPIDDKLGQHPYRSDSRRVDSRSEARRQRTREPNEGGLADIRVNVRTNDHADLALVLARDATQPGLLGAELVVGREQRQELLSQRRLRQRSRPVPIGHVREDAFEVPALEPIDGMRERLLQLDDDLRRRGGSTGWTAALELCAARHAELGLCGIRTTAAVANPLHRPKFECTAALPPRHSDLGHTVQITCR